MGMDVYGRKPSSPTGDYFRANVWSWHPIHALILSLCSDLLDDETLERMALNAGAGPPDQQTCTEMAKRFEQWMEHHTEGYGLESDLRITKEGRFVSAEELANNPDLETVSPYGVSDEHLKRGSIFSDTVAALKFGKRLAYAVSRGWGRRFHYPFLPQT